MVLIASLALAVAASLSVNASPTGLFDRSATVMAMTAAQESSYTPAAMFAQIAYCNVSTMATWKCGASCDALPGVIPFGSGGDGDLTQYWYVAYDPTYFDAVVVAHQGTNPDKALAVLDDAVFFLSPLSQTLFPGVPTTLQAHSGFQATQSRSAPGVLAAVKAAMAATGATKVFITGHSLGAAIALLDAVYLPLHLPAGTTFSTTVFGLPRVGNAAFANYVDSNVTDFAHITNKLDIVPIVPPRLLGFVHPSNEKHIVTSGLDAGDWYACAGQDNTSKDCSQGAVPLIIDGQTADHLGPYGTVMLGIGSCSD